MTRLSLWGRFLLATAVCAAGAVAHASPWVVGQVAPLSGPYATQARAYAQGMRLYFDEVNKAGGIQGEQITLVTQDDRGQPEETVRATREMLAQSKPVVLAGYFGDRNLLALADSGLLAQTQTSLVGYRSVDPSVLQVPQLFNARANTQDEMAKIATHLATVGITKLGLFYEDGPGAASVVKLVEEAIKPAGARLAGHAMLQAQGGARTADAVATLINAQPQAILIIASSPAAAGFIEHYRMSGGTAQIYTNSDADIEQLIKRLSVEHMSGISIAQVVPSPYRVSGRLNKQFRDVVAARGDKLDTPVSYAMMEGYVNARVIAEALRRAPKITPDQIAPALRSIDSVDLGGYWVSFKPRSNQGSRFVELSIVNAAGRVSH